MNAAIFVIDTLQAARDGLVLAGNAPQQADDARRGAVAGVASILCVYRRISEEAILPALRREGLLTLEVQAAWAELRDVAEMAVASADSGGSRTVPAPVSLVDRFEAAAMRQEMVMIPAIRRLPPDVLASVWGIATRREERPCGGAPTAAREQPRIDPIPACPRQLAPMSRMATIATTIATAIAA